LQLLSPFGSLNRSLNILENLYLFVLDFYFSQKKAVLPSEHIYVNEKNYFEIIRNNFALFQIKCTLYKGKFISIFFRARLFYDNNSSNHFHNINPCMHIYIMK
jgi:hypothetical protein